MICKRSLNQGKLRNSKYLPSDVFATALRRRERTLEAKVQELLTEISSQQNTLFAGSRLKLIDHFYWFAMLDDLLTKIW